MTTQPERAIARGMPYFPAHLAAAVVLLTGVLIWRLIGFGFGDEIAQSLLPAWGIAIALTVIFTARAMWRKR